MKVTADRDSVTDPASASAAGTPIETVTSSAGSPLSFTVKVPSPPSATVNDAGATTRSGVSSSETVTAIVAAKVS